MKVVKHDVYSCMRVGPGAREDQWAAVLRKVAARMPDVCLARRFAGHIRLFHTRQLQGPVRDSLCGIAPLASWVNATSHSLSSARNSLYFTYSSSRVGFPAKVFDNHV